jgi:hypothetical protein
MTINIALKFLDSHIFNHRKLFNLSGKGRVKKEAIIGLFLLNQPEFKRVDEKLRNILNYEQIPI